MIPFYIPGNTRKPISWSLKACNFIQKRLQHRCFQVDIANFLITPILKNICERLFLNVIKDSSEEYLETFQTSMMELFEKNSTLRKKCPYLELLWSLFSHIRTGYRRYGVPLRIQPECGKMRTRITTNTGTFYAVVDVEELFDKDVWQGGS